MRSFLGSTVMGVEPGDTPEATALKGINLLVDAGIVYKRRGIGMFVCDGALQKLKEKRQEEFFTQYMLPLIQEAKRLSISPQQLQEWIERGFSR